MLLQVLPVEYSMYHIPRVSWSSRENESCFGVAFWWILLYTTVYSNSIISPANFHFFWGKSSGLLSILSSCWTELNLEQPSSWSTRLSNLVSVWFFGQPDIYAVLIVLNLSLVLRHFVKAFISLLLWFLVTVYSVHLLW